MASADMQLVSRVLMDADIFGENSSSDSVRAMLLAALPFAEGGHAYQQEVLKQCHDLLSEKKTLSERDSGLLGDEAAAASGRIAEAEQAMVMSASATQQAQEAVTLATTALEHQASIVEKAKADEAESCSAHVANVEVRDQLAQKKAAVDFAVAALKAEGPQDPSDEVVQVLKEAGAEKPLLDACPVAMALSPANRGEFDTLTMDTAREVLLEYQARLEAELTEAQVAVRDAQSEACGCEALREVEEERKEASASSLEAAVQDAKARQAEEEAAKRAVNAREAERTDFLVRQVLAQDRASKAAAAMSALDRLSSPATAAEASQDVDMGSIEAKAATTEAPKVDAAMGDLLRHATELGA